MMTLLPYGDSALLVNFEQKIDKTTHAEVIKLETAIKQAGLEGLRFYIPAYCSLTVGYDPGHWTFAELSEKIKTLSGNSVLTSPEIKPRVLKIPVCYEGEYAPDWQEVEQATGNSREGIIRVHTNTEFHVYMLGFLPGFVYLGTMPDALNISRKTRPRLRVPAGSVGLAGVQTGIYPSEAPGGWQIIGRTPLKIFDPRKEHPFLFQPGDRVNFYQIASAEFEQSTEADWQHLQMIKPAG